MPYLIGGILALAVGGLATLIGLDRDRAFYPTVLIAIASYYPLVAVMGGSHPALVVESGVATTSSYWQSWDLGTPSGSSWLR